MIRINLLGGERQKAKKAFALDGPRRTALACSVVVVAGALGIGWWYWALAQASTQVDAEILAARQEAARLQSVLVEVRQFEQRRGQLQQRVALIEQLRGGQSIPVQLLDHVSRSLPDMLWLTKMDQENGALVLEGRSTTLIALSDFVGNLANTTLLKKPIEIVDSQVEAVTSSGAPAAAAEVIKFTVKAQLAAPGSPAPSARPVPAVATVAAR